jgi:hypothetical protein
MSFAKLVQTVLDNTAAAFLLSLGGLVAGAVAFVGA